jgi:hypothetical protein
VLFETHWLPPNGLMYGYDVTRDGQRFLGPAPAAAETARALTLMTNWQWGHLIGGRLIAQRRRAQVLARNVIELRSDRWSKNGRELFDELRRRIPTGN